MELVAKRMLNFLSDYRAFDSVYEHEESEGWTILEVQQAFLEKKWEKYFGTNGTWEECRRGLPDDPADDEFLFYLAKYLSDYYYNTSQALQDALAVVWVEDKGIEMMSEYGRSCVDKVSAGMIMKLD